MRFGIIGYGKIARKFVKSITYSNNNEVVAIASRSVKADDEYIVNHPSVKVYQDYNDLLNDDNVDAVYIAIPHKYHYEWIIKALQHKKAVLSEKPAVLKKEEMEHIKQVATENHVCFLEALKTKMNDSFIHLKEDIKMIGEIESIEANFCFDGTSLKGTGTYLFEEDQGGALNDVGSYLLGFTMSLVNSKVIHVDTVAKIVDGVDEHFHAYLAFENGTIAHLEGAIDQNKERYAMIKGKMGNIYVPMFNRMNDYTIMLPGGTEIKRDYPIVGDDMTYQINIIADCASKGLVESPLHTLDEMIEIVDVTCQIRNSFK